MYPAKARYRLEWLHTYVTWPVMSVSQGVLVVMSLINPAPFSDTLLAGWLVICVSGLTGMYCQDLRWRSAKRKALCTTGPYAIVRHPIYHAFILSSLGTLLVADLSRTSYWFVWAIGMTSAAATCLLEEGVVRAEWGAAAERYYARTPRFLYEWLWFRRR